MDTLFILRKKPKCPNCGKKMKLKGTSKVKRIGVFGFFNCTCGMEIMSSMNNINQF